MNTTADFDRNAEAWLADGPTELADRVLDAALREVHLTKQRRRWSMPWRTSPMSLRLNAVALVAIIATAGVTGLLLLRGPSAGPPRPTAVPTASPAPTTSQAPSATVNPLLDTTAWSAYTSSEYGFVIGHPADWSIDPAARAWNLETDAGDWQSPAMDDFVNPAGEVRLSIWNVALAPGTIVTSETSEVETWYEQVYCPKTDSLSCTGFHDRVVPLCLEVRDCHPGMLLTSNSTDTQAFFSSTNEDGMTVVTIWRAENDPSTLRYGGTQRLLEAFLSTMNVWPMDRRPAFEDQFWSPAPSPAAT